MDSMFSNLFGTPNSEAALAQFCYMAEAEGRTDLISTEEAQRNKEKLERGDDYASGIELIRRLS
jgi:hypothetical protein